MIQTVEAIVDRDGQVRLLGPVALDAPRRALVIVLDEPAVAPGEATRASEASLAEDWTRSEEDAAWAHLQPPKDGVDCDVKPAPPTEAQRRELERRLADSIARPDAVTPWEDLLTRAQSRAR